MSMSTLAPEDLAAISAHLKSQAARREQQSPGGGLAAPAVVPTLPGRAPMTLSDAIMLDLRPIVAQRPTAGANAARAIPVHAAAPGPSDAPPPPSAAPAPIAHSGPLRMRTASAKAVAAAETEQLLGQLDKAAPPPPAAAAPTAPPPASTSPAEAAPKPRSAAPPSPKSGGPKRRRENSGSGGAAGGSDTGEEGETSDEDGIGIGDGDADPRRQRRVLSNRESARRSRRRKMERLQELASDRDAARQECAILRAALLRAGIPLPSGVTAEAPGAPLPQGVPLPPGVKAEAEPKHKGVATGEAGKVAALQAAAPVAKAPAEVAAAKPIAKLAPAKAAAEVARAKPIAKPAPAAPAGAVQTPSPPSVRVTRAAQAAQSRGVTTRASRGRKTTAT